MTITSDSNKFRISVMRPRITTVTSNQSEPQVIVLTDEELKSYSVSPSPHTQTIVSALEEDLRVSKALDDPDSTLQGY